MVASHFFRIEPVEEVRSRLVRGRTFFTVLLAALLTGGCSQGLPRLRDNVLAGRFAPIPETASPVLQWTGEKQGLFTYWYRQDVRVAVRAYIPQGVTTPEDTLWEVEARNAEGKRLPFLGIVRRYRNEQGTPLAVLHPPVDLNTLPDGLYISLDPQFTVTGDRIETIQPTALVNEVRHHAFQPFRVRIPLIPLKATALTPMPKLAPEPPSGTPIPVPTEVR